MATGFAAANAQGGEAAPVAPARFQGGQQGGEDARARGSDRVAEGAKRRR